MAITIFNAALGGAFVASQPILMQGERVSLDFDIAVTAGPCTVEWFLEFATGNPLAPGALWRREVAEEDIGGGVTNMPKVVRKLLENGGAGLAVGTHRLSAQAIRAHQFFRIQMRVALGAASAVAHSVFGTTVSAPVT
jgi:hypothetical protein